MSDPVTLDCEVPTFKQFTLLATQSKLSVDWFDEERKLAFKRLLDEFHNDIARHQKLTSENYKTNAAALVKEANTLRTGVERFIKPLKEKPNRTEKERKFVKLVEDQVYLGAGEYATKLNTLVKSRYTKPETLSDRDEEKNNDPRLKQVNPFTNFVQRTNGFAFEPRNMQTPEHAAAYMDSFDRAVRQLTNHWEGRSDGPPISEEDVANKVGLLDSAYERLRRHIDGDQVLRGKCSSGLAPLKQAVAECNAALRRVPVKSER